MGNAVTNYFELSISVESGWNEFGMRDCMKLLISSFLDNILYKCRMHVFLKHSWLMELNGAIILSAGCIQKGTMLCQVW